MSIFQTKASLSCVVLLLNGNHKQKTFVSSQTIFHSGLLAYFFSGNGTPETNLSKNVIKAAEYPVNHPFFKLQDMI